MSYAYKLIASPVGTYFSGGVKPVTVWVSRDYTRAAPGGTGSAKCGGNYAASLIAQAEAIENGCDQVVFLDAVERRFVDELGGMNVFFVYDDGTLVTPPLTGTILPGITRDAVLTLAAEAGHRVQERPVSFADWQADAASGRLREVFACGTAAVVTPIGGVRFPDGEFLIGGGEPGQDRVVAEAVEHVGRADEPDQLVHDGVVGRRPPGIVGEADDDLGRGLAGAEPDGRIDLRVAGRPRPRHRCRRQREKAGRPAEASHLECPRRSPGVWGW